MATKLSGFARSTLKGSYGMMFKNKCVAQTISKRAITFSETGAVFPDPPKTRGGLIGVGIIVPVFIFLGAMIGKEAAAFMVENDIFIPDDDDDD